MNEPTEAAAAANPMQATTEPGGIVGQDGTPAPEATTPEVTEADAEPTSALVAMRSHVTHPSGASGALASLKRDEHGKIVAVRLQAHAHHLTDWLPVE